jgi:hypothetical protein
MLRLVFSAGLATGEEEALEGIESYLRDIAKDCGDLLAEFS